MKYNIKIMSKDEAIDFNELYHGNDKYLMLSISDKSENLRFLRNNNNVIIHQFFFADIEYEIEEIKEFGLMTNQQAIEIKNLIDKYTQDGITNIIVHCHAGISRSGAVGCLIAKYLNGDDTYLWKTEYIYPNRYIYKLMSNAFNIEYSDKDFEYKQALRHNGI